MADLWGIIRRARGCSPLFSGLARRLVLLATSLMPGIALLGASRPSAAETLSSRPNIVLLLADDLGWSDTTLYGTTSFYQTPHIERLARRGMTFTRAYAASPLCSPTRSAILTGLSPARTGLTSPGCHLPQVVLQATTAASAAPDQQAISPKSITRLDPQSGGLAQTLRAAGYATAHFGKWHLGPEPYSPLEHGFDVDVPHWPGPGPAGSYVAPWKFRDFDPDPGVPDQHIEDRMAQEAIAWMEQHRSEPFFLNYWMFSVHAPFDAKTALIEKHRTRIEQDNPQRSPTYAAMVESLDDAVGTLLDAIDRLGVAENTIVIFTSDNGGNMYNEADGTTPTSNAPLRGGKATMFEGGTRVPCVICWPGVVEPGSRSDALVQSEDFYPTLRDALGLSVPADHPVDGVSLLPALKGEPLTREAVFQYFPHAPGVPDWLPPSVSVHQGDWKLIRIFHGGESGAHRHLLFNLREDLGETTDLSADRTDIVTELDRLIDQFLMETGAVVPIPNPAFDPAKYRPEAIGKAKPRRNSTPRAKPAAGRDPGDVPALQGWKARGGRATAAEGVATFTPTDAAPFLGVASGRIEGPATLRFRMKASSDTGRVDWLAGGTSLPQDKTATVAYQVKAGEWSERAVALPLTDNAAGIIRLYLPPGEQPILIDWIELTTSTATRRWNF